MKKILILILAILIVFPLITALNLKVEKISEGEVMIIGINSPVLFKINITNYGPKENLELYNLVGLRFLPAGRFIIESFETKQIDLQVSPIGEFNHLGKYTFKYFIRNNQGNETQYSLSFKRIELQEALEIGAGSIDPESNSIQIFLQNKENFDLGEVKAKFSSNFFNKEETFDLGPKQRKNISIDLNKQDFNQLMAGFYTLSAEIKAGEVETKLEAPLEFEEKQLISTLEEKYGGVVVTKIIKKTNQGNTIANIQITSDKNIISRLFTTFKPEPDDIQRKGFKVEYVWNQQLKPGESLEVSIKTNYIFPLIIIILVLAIIAFARYYSSSNLTLKKRVSFVKAKGGAFALKVTIYAHSKKYIENITIIDKLPPLVKIYEKFGQEKPARINEKTKRIEWDYQKLEPGEIRMMTYIIYSKVGVMGKFALPETRGIYEKDGKIHETESNRTFFVSEPRGKEEE